MFAGPKAWNVRIGNELSWYYVHEIFESEEEALRAVALNILGGVA